MITANDIARLRAGVDDLVSRHERTVSITDFAKYADDPEGFFRDVLRCDPWAKQIEMAVRVRDHRRVVVVTANGIGKDFITARIALWWIYACRGFVIVTGPTERQVKAICMRELRRAFAGAPELPGEMYSLELRVTDDIGLIAFTSDNADRLTGFHHPRLLICMTEGQGVEDDAYEAAQACCTGPNNRMFVYGNPTRPSGAFYRAAQSDAWSSLTVSAFEHPNVVSGREEIPGAISREFIALMREEYGESSPVYLARVCAKFPEDALESLIPRAWIRAAFDRHEAQGVSVAHASTRLHLALDVARYGPDASVLAFVRGPVVEKFETWKGVSTTTTVERVLQHAGAACGPGDIAPRDVSTTLRWHSSATQTVQAEETPPVVVVDDAGLGGGATDQLRALGQTVVAYNGANSPRDGKRFLNVRAESYWLFRKGLEDGVIALPRDPLLEEEAAAVEWFLNANELIQIIDKKLIRKAIGRSPDRLDSAVMGLYESLAPPRPTPPPWGSARRGLY